MSVADPVRFTFCGLIGALSMNVSFPVLVPVAVGVKVTLAVQVASGANCAGGTGHVLVGAKSPLVETFLMVTGRGNEFVAVTVLEGLVVPMVWRENFRLVGEKVRPLQTPALPAL